MGEAVQKGRVQSCSRLLVCSYSRLRDHLESWNAQTCTSSSNFMQMSYVKSYDCSNGIA